MNTLVKLAHANKRIKELESGHAEAVTAFVDAIEALDSENPETAHPKGDALLSKFLRDIGHRDAANANDAARENWWYA